MCDLADRSTPTAVDALLFQLRAAGLPEPEREWRFLPGRRYRIDLAYPNRRWAIECEGGVWVNGRHTRPSGYLGDMRKYNELAIAGWRLLRVTPDMIERGEALALVERVLGEGAST